MAEYDRSGAYLEDFDQSPGEVDSSQGQKRILIVDDDALLCDLAYDVLSPLGYTVIGACDTAEALMLYREAWRAGSPFDAVLMDLCTLTGQDGRQTIAQLRAPDSQVKILAFSGDTRLAVLEEVNRCGFDYFLAKPYSIATLRYVVQTLVARRQVGL